MSDSDPFPPDEIIRSANADLVALVRRGLPRRFWRSDRTATHWSFWGTAAIVRMADTVDAAMRLWVAGNESDGRTLVRSLYEQVVTFAWIAIDPGPHYSRWFAQSLWEDLRLHNDAMRYGERVLSDDEVATTRQLLKLDQAEADEDAEAAACTRPRRRKTPDPQILLPHVTDRAHEADVYWSLRIRGLHGAGHMLGFRGLYLPAFRTTSRSVHGALGGLGVYVTDRPNRKVVDVARPEGRLMWALIGPLFGMALVIASQEITWIDEVEVRRLVDQATGPKPKQA
jgi:Family of unknown function (DUF5677)